MISIHPARIAIEACGLVAVLASVAIAQVPRDVVDIDYDKHKFISLEGCKKCHIEPGTYANTDVTDRVYLTEWKTWSEQDKHSEAYLVLSDERGRRMGELLRKDVKAESTGCIQCHTPNAIRTRWDANCLQNAAIKEDCLSTGVDCQACHGPAADWVGPHQLGDWWKKTARQKADLGFRPVHDPLFRAEMCLSCHVGNPSENKVITHEMYAAGHPPLSGFELESFADKMPRHWRQSYEKPKATPTYERTRNMLVANVVSLRFALELASADVAANQDGQHWPELARLECYACHHDLRLPSWRQSRSTAGRVGRPQLNLGCEPLVRVAARVVLDEVGKQAADALLARVQTEIFAENVFGSPQAISRLAPVVRQWCLDLEAKLLATPFTTAKIVDVLDEVYQAADQQLKDYDTARQLTGAIVIICDELALVDTTRATPQRVADRLGKLRTGFNLHVDMKARVEETLKQSLQRRAGFKPEVFARLISSLEKYPRD